MTGERFARRVFTGAGIYGIACIVPMYGLERYLGEQYPPPITHPEFFYGFAGVTLAWQLVFLVMGGNPVRYRPLMLPAIVEKLGWGVAVSVLVTGGRTSPAMLPPAFIDLALAVLFALSYVRTRASHEN